MTMPTDSATLINFIQAHQCDWSKIPDPTGEQWGIHLQDDPPHNQLLGPVFERGATAGMVVHKGVRLCEWGDTQRADMTFSVTKTYLALVTGIAVDKGLLADLDQPISEVLPNIGFNTPQNISITWRQMLQFTSEWEGSCFGIPDQIDHYRQVSLNVSKSHNRKGQPRPLQAAGQYWEYNDVRINQFSVALLHLFGKPLPEILKTEIMDPLGASDTWRWHGYDNSWVETENGRFQSVPGGGHWGGGMVISPEDQIKVAQLMIDQGCIYKSGKAKQLLSTNWIKTMTTPCEIAPFYGFFTWLNKHHLISKVASESSYFAMGIGGQYLLHDPERELVACYRWIDPEAFSPIVAMTYNLLD